jgi:hypothetical protein
MRARLAAAAAGTILIAAAIFAFSVSSHPVIAGTNTVEPITPSVSVEGGQPQCQRIPRVPPGADRLKLLVTFVTGGASRLQVEITDPRGIVSRGDLNPASAGEKLIELTPPMRASHRATLCLSNPGPGRLMIGGDLKRSEGEPKGEEIKKHGVASAIFLRPGSSRWIAETGTIVDRYANAQTGPLGGWTVWGAALLAIGAALIGIWSVVTLPGRRT